MAVVLKKQARLGTDGRSECRIALVMNRSCWNEEIILMMTLPYLTLCITQLTKVDKSLTPF